MANQQKKPKKSDFIHPKSSKMATHIGNPQSYYARNPSWRVSLLEMVEPFGWHKIERGKWQEVISKLRNFESRTWSEILIQSKKQNHAIPVWKIEKSAQDRLAELNLDDIDELISLRLSGKERVWGIMYDGILKVLWWDPNHLVCKSSKKNS